MNDQGRLRNPEYPSTAGHADSGLPAASTAEDSIIAADSPLRNVRIVLHQPRGAANVGAVARAIANTGLGALVIVRRRPVREAWMRAMAAHAGDVVDNMRRLPSLADAVADCALVVGTTCRGGPYRQGTLSPRVAAPMIVARARRQPVALVFGPEDHGLSNADLGLCQQLITIPASPAYVSLNLAQAVMICAYELFVAAQEPTTLPLPLPLATVERVEQAYTHLRRALLAIGFLHPDNPEHIMHALRRLFGRAGLEEREVRILLGLARQIEWFGGGGWRTISRKVESATED